MNGVRLDLREIEPLRPEDIIVSQQREIVRLRAELGNVSMRLHYAQRWLDKVLACVEAGRDVRRTLRRATGKVNKAREATLSALRRVP